MAVHTESPDIGLLYTAFTEERSRTSCARVNINTIFTGVAQDNSHWKQNQGRSANRTEDKKTASFIDTVIGVQPLGRIPEQKP